jgi:hypothetical protein
VASRTDTQWRNVVLMPSTPLAYPQVISRRFALFRVVKFSISAVHAVLSAWFDSRQLH